MKLGKYSIFLLIFLLQFNISFSQSVTDTAVDELSNLPSTYEEEEILEDENLNPQILQKVKFNEPINLNDETIIVNLKALDKITAKTSTLSIKLGEEKYFGNLKIRPLKCISSKLDQSPDTIAYLQVTDISMENNNQVFVFNGWTFASSPTLRSLDHAIYDLWLLSCSNI